MTVVLHRYQDQCETLKERGEREGERRRGTRMKKTEASKEVFFFSALKNVIDRKEDGKIYIVAGTAS